MLLEDARTLVADYGRRLLQAGLTAGTGGNLSVRDPATGYIAVSPSGMDYGLIGPEAVTVLDMSGAVVDGSRRPTTEWAMHLAFYAARPDRHGAVHTHSPAATALACLRRELPAMSYLVALCGRDRVPCAPYRDFGTPALAQAAVEAADGCDGVLLANHGLICLGADMAAAFQLAEQLEFCAQVYMRCLAAGQEPVLLTAQEMDRARAQFGVYGQGKERR